MPAALARRVTRTVILGAGFGGLSAATELAAALPRDDVLLVDERDWFVMGLAKLQIMDGRRTPADAARRLRGVERHGVQFVRGAVERIEEARVIVHGEPLPFDHLVLALGARTAPRSGSGPL